MLNYFRLLPVLLCSCFLFIPLLTTSALADSLQFQTDTLISFFERDTSKGTNQQVSPAYLYFTLDSSKDEPAGFSFHGQGWGRIDASDSNYFSDQSDGDLNYAYLEYSAPETIFTARLGRVHAYENGANESLDGLWLATAFGQYVSLTTYAGLPVSVSEVSGRTSDSIYGGRVAIHKNADYELGVFYKSLDNDGNTQQQSLGFDLFAILPLNARFYGSSTQNRETENWAEHHYELRIPISNVTIRPYYELYNYDDYFNTGTTTPNPFKLLSTSGESLATTGLDATWNYSSGWAFAGKIKQYSYDNNDASQYASLLATWSSEENGLAQVGGEIGYLKGDAANNDYVLLRLYGYKEQLGKALWFDIASADIVYAVYDQDIFGKNTSLFSSVSLGKNFFDNSLKLTLSGDYSQTPYYQDDFRALMKISYRFDVSM